jgi:hypothetical protein
MRLVRLIGKVVPGLVVLFGLLLLSAGDGAPGANATPGGIVKLPTKGIAWNANNIGITLDVDDLGTEENCFLNPGIAASGSGATVS